MRKLPLHIWILLALVLGVAYGYVSAILGAHEHVLTFVKPIGDLFLNLLQMIAVPLVLFSLVAWVASLRDASKLARIGGKTVVLYLATTAVAITLGLLVVNLLEPGAGLSPELRDHLRSTVLAGTSSDTVERRIEAGQGIDFAAQLVNIVPKNPFASLSQGSMLQIVFFALMLGFSLTRPPDLPRTPLHVEVVQRATPRVLLLLPHLVSPQRLRAERGAPPEREPSKLPPRFRRESIPRDRSDGLVPDGAPSPRLRRHQPDEDRYEHENTAHCKEANLSRKRAPIRTDNNARTARYHDTSSIRVRRHSPLNACTRAAPQQTRRRSAQRRPKKDARSAPVANRVLLPTLTISREQPRELIHAHGDHVRGYRPTHVSDDTRLRRAVTIAEY